MAKVAETATRARVNAFLFDKKIRTKLNKPDLALIIDSGCSLVSKTRKARRPGDTAFESS